MTVSDAGNKSSVSQKIIRTRKRRINHGKVKEEKLIKTIIINYSKKKL